jgi:hypothetical protein
LLLALPPQRLPLLLLPSPLLLPPLLLPSLLVPGCCLACECPMGCSHCSPWSRRIELSTQLLNAVPRGVLQALLISI